MTSSLTLSLTSELRKFIDKMAGKDGLYNTPSEYVRDLIRKDLQRIENSNSEKRILKGIKDLKEGNIISIDKDELLSDIDD